MTLTDLGNATAVLGGIPATGSAGTYPVEISATNAGGTAQQAFILTVSAAGGTVASVAGDANGGAGYGGDFGPGTGGLLYSPRAVAVDEWGDVFIADSFNNQIREVDTFGNIYRIAGDGQPGYSGDGGLGIYAALNNPQGITVDNEGDVFVADTSSHVVREIDTHDVITTVAGNGTYGDSGDGGPAVAAEFWEPAGLVFDKAGDLFVADQATGRIRRVGIDGTVSAFAGRSNPNGDPDGGDGGLALAATFRLPTTLAIAASGAMYVTDLSGLRVIAANGTVSTLGTGSYVSRDANNGGPVSGAYLSGCRGLAVDPTGNVYLGAQAFLVTVGTHPFGMDLALSGVNGLNSYSGPLMPPGRTLYATLYTEYNNAWVEYQAITYTAAVVASTFARPSNGQTGVDPTAPVVWNSIAGVQGYIFIVGTAPYAFNVDAERDPAIATESAPRYLRSPGAFPANTKLFATLFTEVDGAYTGYQSMSFTTRSYASTFTNVVNGQLNVPAGTTLTWKPRLWAQRYDISIGTTPTNGNLAGTMLPSNQTSYTLPSLPSGKVLFVTLTTDYGPNATYSQIVGITLAPPA